MNIITKICKHFCLVNKHRWLVFILACRAGIPWRGLVHDLSKYSPTEFFESVNYYTGNKSPITCCRADKGYSLSWLHHKGRNKHHFEYWEDINRTSRIPVRMPYNYIVESVCDRIAAGMAYRGNEWTQKDPYDYWVNNEKKSVLSIHPSNIKFMDIVLKKIYDEGLYVTLNKKYLMSVYKECDE